MAKSLGLSESPSPDADLFELDSEFDYKSARKKLQKVHLESQRKLRAATVPDCLRTNVARLAELAGMTLVDAKILEFAALLHTEDVLEKSARYLGRLSSAQVPQVLAVVLDCPEAAVREALHSQGILAQAGLLTMDRHGEAYLPSKLELLSHMFGDRLCATDTDPVHLLRDIVVPGTPAKLSFSDYEHLTTPLSLLRLFLRHAIDTGRKGVNIFLYGNPGTGKSQLARVLAQEMECELFEVTSEDNDGNPTQGVSRLRAFRAAQCFFGRQRTLIAFDEAEDAFQGKHESLLGMLGMTQSTAQPHKAWLNRMLEGNAAPTLWLSNSIHGIDPAIIRRFDMVLELPVPPRKQRERILGQACGDLLDAQALTRIAQSEALAPAVVTRAASVVHAVRDGLGHEGAAPALEWLINSTLKAQGHSSLPRHGTGGLPGIYDPAFIQADADLVQVAAGLQQSKAGRLCLYGPPGTGKTAYGRWLAEQLGVPLVLKRASDLLSKWLGDSEKNIAEAFEQAEREGALLLIDEMDSFLQDRRGAQRSWEVTQVNEMLTRMESFPGVFIATTNLMQNLDPAALRRFDLKVKFDYLRPEQGSELLRHHCAWMKLDAPSDELVQRLRRVKVLTPGDFAAVARQHRFRPLASAADWVAALEAECALKEGAKEVVGFLQ